MRIKEVIDSNLCIGCGLCVNSTDDMIINTDGFFSPINLIEDSISDICCPGKGIVNISDDSYNLHWGALHGSYVGSSKNNLIRHNGSSGGMLTEILTFLLEKSLVDKVILIKGNNIVPIRNETIIASSIEEVISCAGSRYSPSSPLSIIRPLLSESDHTRYAFIGKPCDVAALRMLINLRKDLSNKFPYLLSFICAGVPSEKATEKILLKFGVQADQLISFRYRGDGWPGVTKAVTKDNHEYSMSYNESWGSILNKHLHTRCKLCVDGIGESADIVCGDAWHESKDGYPSFDEAQGRSLILVRNSNGKKLIQELMDNNRINIENFHIEDIKKIQPYQWMRKKTLLARILAIKLLGGKTPHYKGFFMLKNAIGVGLTKNIRFFCGALVRKIKGKI